MAASTRLPHDHRNAVRVRVVEPNFGRPQIAQPGLDFFSRMLPSVLRMIPIEIDHVICLEIKTLVPEAFQNIVINEPLHIMGTRRNIEHRNWTLQSDLRIEARQLTTEFGDRFTSGIAVLQTQFSKLLPYRSVSELTKCSHS